MALLERLLMKTSQCWVREEKENPSRPPTFTLVNRRQEGIAGSSGVK
jgi:hypothetical protein